MNDRWSRVGQLFARVLECSPDAREAFIAASSEPDEVKDDVRSLLAAHGAAEGFLERSPSHVPASGPGPGETSVTAGADGGIAEGTEIGPYRVDRVIGRGGMGVVYRAEDVRLHRPVAIKALAPELAADDRQRERLKLEARAAAALVHPGIAIVHALEEWNGQWLIVSEYLEGETLRAEMDRGRPPFARAVTDGLEIARALAAAHDRGIVHRDLKPENIVRTSQRTLKILDFGLAQFHDGARELASLTRLTQSGLVAGTPPYMAPEQLLGRETDARTDQFAFGVLFYELCTGRHPFGGRSLPSTIAHILAAEPAPPESGETLPAHAWLVVSRCLQKDPGQRFDTTRDLVIALESLRGPAPPALPALPVLPAPPALPVLPALQWWRFHQLAATIVFALMVWPCWRMHGAFGRVGLMAFFTVLAAVIVSSTLRLHLWFSSRVYPEDLGTQRAHVARWIQAADVSLAVLLIIGGIALPERSAGWATVFIAVGIATGLSTLFIEPATARAAFRSNA